MYTNRIREHLESEERPEEGPYHVVLESDTPCYECGTRILAGRVSLLETLLGTLVRLTTTAVDTPEVADLRARVAETSRDALEDPSWWTGIWHGPSVHRN